MRGIPRRTNPGSSLLFEDGSTWSVPLYACASAIKATINTVTMHLNNTATLENLNVTSIVPKTYRDTGSMPLWGFEESGLSLDGISPLWGIVDEKYENRPNVSFWRKPSLYLVGASDTLGQTLGGIANRDFQYVPGTDFAPAAMNTLYTFGTSSSIITNSVLGLAIDYTGAQNMAMYLRWQNLSANAGGAAQILNLIWTDLVASAVVGTKGTLGIGNTGTQGQVVKITVHPIARKIKYHIPFAIPAFVLAFALLGISISTIVSMFLGNASTGTLRKRLHQSSPGRLLVRSLAPIETIWTMSSKEWSREFGYFEVDLSEESQILPVDQGTALGKGENASNVGEHEIPASEAPEE